MPTTSSDDVPPALAAALRGEALALRRRERRRSFPMVLHVGLPGGPREELPPTWPRMSALDDGLRVDLAAALVERWLLLRQQEAHAWLTRPGSPVLHDEDAAWHAATWRALGVHGLELLGFWAVTRSGWLDVRSGASRSWKRLR